MGRGGGGGRSGDPSGMASGGTEFSGRAVLEG